MLISSSFKFHSVHSVQHLIGKITKRISILDIPTCDITKSNRWVVEIVDKTTTHIIMLLIIIAVTQFFLINSYSCPNFCSSRGLCLNQGRCICPEGWAGADCSLATCPFGIAWADYVQGIDMGHNLAECSNRGSCDRESGFCKCDRGFTGAACDRMECDCNGHGRCDSMREYALTSDPGVGSIFTYRENWDSAMIHGCLCDQGYTGPQCAQRVCPTGDDPLTGTAADPNGLQYNEKQKIHCKATAGSFKLTFRGFTTDSIFFDDNPAIVKAKLILLPSIFEVDVAFQGTVTSACTTTGNDITIEFTQQFGNVPDLIFDEVRLSHSAPSQEPVLDLSTLQEGTKENAPCSNRGKCNENTGICECYFGFTIDGDATTNIGRRGDCGVPTNAITACPGDIACSGHGICSGPPTYNCVCDAGFMSGDCSQRLCPTGKAWFDRPSGESEFAHQPIECSNAGYCDRDRGWCICSPGFTGSSCNRLECPENCSGHGTCLTIEQLAKMSKINGEVQDWTYGLVPHKKETWDHNMITGCHCDKDWTGHDCSQKTCPTGDDPITEKNLLNPKLQQMNEKQVLKCIGNSGYFALQFRDEQTALLPYSVSSVRLSEALNELSTIDKVAISYSILGNNQPACTPSGINTITIEFLTNFGTLPPLRYIVDGDLVIDVTTGGAGQSIVGTKEDAICSNRGVCNTQTGICHCAYGFTSSNGFGQEGFRGDCGYMDPIYLNSAEIFANEEEILIYTL